MAVRICQSDGCRNHIPKGSRVDRLYCSDVCRDRESKRRKRVRDAYDLGVRPGEQTGGDTVAWLEAHPQVVDALVCGEITRNRVGGMLGMTGAAVGTALTEVLRRASDRKAAATWSPSPDAVAMIGGDLDWPEPGNVRAVEGWATDMTERFVAFRNAFFTTPRGPYLTEGFHRRWIRAILISLATGGRQMILSPPRHGKSELLVHFCVWLIQVNPNIRIIWIGGNGEIAGDMTSAVKNTLADNLELRKTYLAPGTDYVPPVRSSKPWGSTKFTVNTRTVDSKAATMVAVGRQGKILSRDVDLLVCDDIEDFDSTESEAVRGQTRSWWFNTVESRKEEHTAWVTIGSRQHPDDLYNYLLDDAEWNTIVDSAHNPDCGIDPHTVDAHVACMLFPRLRSYAWLEGKRRTAENQGLLANYEMVYLNDPRPEGHVIYSAEAIRNSYNPSRGLGVFTLEDDSGNTRGLRLVAGLDPSSTGYQAGFLWGYDPDTKIRYMIDSDNRQGGGIAQAMALMVRWYETYGCAHWVVEDNGFQRAIRMDEKIREWANRAGVFIEGHQTQGQNKNDPLFGVGAMARLYDASLVDLPYGTDEAREKTVAYTRQMLTFTDVAYKYKRTNRKTDILMASWFPQKVLRRWEKEYQAEMDVDYEPSYAGFEMSEITDLGGI